MINKLVVENLKHRPVRTTLSIVAISIQVTMVLTLVGLSAGMLDEQARRARGIGADIIVRPPSSSVLNFGLNMSADLIPKFINLQPHVAAATGVLVYPTGMLNYITGIDLAQFSQLNGGFRFVQGGPFQGPDDMLVDTYYADQHKYHVGDAVTELNRPWKLTGIYEPGMLARQVVPLATLQDLTGSRGKISVIYVKLDDPAKSGDVITSLGGRLKDYKIFSMQEYTDLYSVNSVPMLKTFTIVVIAIGVLVGFLMVFLSMYTAVLERTREIGVLKALGASPEYILNILLRETAFLAVAGSLLGILLSYATRFTINDVIHGSLIQSIVYKWWAIAAVIAIVGAMLGAIYPGLKAARQDAIEALAYE
ncbi:MAG TPA: FtsX-like permease family protein [Bryobacteraceae bacterium]|nr:FtsX-like permease family protein [Bryobacteraceae bacterium]